MKKKLYIKGMLALAIVSVMTVGTSVHASSLTPAQVQAVIGLMQAFGANASTISNVEAALLGTAASASSSVSSNSACVSLSHSLVQGDTDAKTGGDVSKLQRFLGGKVTGYFGPQTLALVKAWQSSHGVVSSGSAATTGFGAVGPKTRAAMSCKAAGATSSASVPALHLTAAQQAKAMQARAAAALNWRAGSDPSADPNARAAIVSVTQSTSTSTASISGTAQQTSSLEITLTNNGAPIWITRVPIYNGTWTMYLPSSMATSSTYSIDVKDWTSGRDLAQGTMTLAN